MPSPSKILSKRSSTSSYAKAGVDVALGNRLKSGIGQLVRPTHGAEVLGGIGGFGGLFRPDFKGRKIKDPVLVSSVDGVGTKLKIAFATNRHDTIGADLVNHCLNDIAVTGARPLFFLDYIAAEKLEPTVLRQIITGVARACKAAGCALIGGETAQMPGLYHPGEYDLAGTIVGVVDRKQLLDGSRVTVGDSLIGLPSNGLHTNGYSLARKVLLETMKLKLSSRPQGLTTTLEAELLKVHRSYLPAFEKVATLGKKTLHAAAHITGGGLIDNLPRILPSHCDAFIDSTSWKIPAIFQLIAQGGSIDPLEMYRVFNMGIGMVLVVSKENEKQVAKLVGGKIIGKIIKGTGDVQLEPANCLTHSGKDYKKTSKSLGKL
ncbi:MAG: phosphoribosylformylglycinamidine cyclo-ligase [Verrucomicrobia bacterium RIFCSPHIGHO2_12_FULL_41_10]|nr:MAG: phosphoribosylformylglycinamidine cyclo-ligase [Verrucomicrobia bacterium RIFCSPHIGHO2_12_FULL_41_10]HLB34747.1 phosphoribosylformylglycinamidine cyclo-ligase [Chthoniobacterales bacterium]